MVADRSVLVRLRANVSEFNRDIGTSTAAVSALESRLKSADREGGAAIDKLSGRIRLFLDAFAMVGPAAIPITAVAIPAVTGLAAQLGFASVAGGIFIASMQGVGDALKAANAYAIDPSKENLEKLQETMQAIGPDARAFVFELRALIPALKELRDTGAENLIPGLTMALDSLEGRLPELERIIDHVSRTLADITADSAGSLNSERWDEFTDFIATDTSQSLVDLSSIIGDITHGLSEMWMAFDPVNDDFSTWLVGQADDFDKWAQGLSKTEGFEEFIDYIRTNGPQVAATMSAIGGATLQFVEATAPIGGPVLKVLESVFDVIGGIADSDLGTPIMAGVAALSLYNRTLMVTASLQGRINAAGAAGGGGLFGMMGARQAAGKSAMAGARADVEALAATWATAGARTTREQARMAASAKSLRSNLGGVAKEAGRIAGPLAGIGLVATGASEGLGLTNTATLALMGSFAGAPGAAIGAGVGLFLDLKAAGNESADALDRLADAHENLDLSGLAAGLDPAKKALEDYKDTTGIGDLFGDIGSHISNTFQGRFSAGEIETETAAAEDALDRLSGAFETVGRAMGEDFQDSMGRSVVPSVEQLLQIAERAEPAMAALGITTDDLLDMNPEQLHSTAEAIAAWTSQADTAQGRTLRLRDAMIDLDNGMVSTSASADELGNSLEALLAPGINLSAATDAWHAGLRNLKDELHDTSRELKGNTDAADENREAIRSQVTRLTDLMKTQAENGAGMAQLTRQMKNGRKAILDAGEAAGLARGDVRDFLNELGLTPKVVRTIIEAQTEKAKANVQTLQQMLADLRDKTINVSVVTTRITRSGQRSGVNPLNPYDPAAADGTFVPKTGLPYADRHPYLLADGEGVTTNRRGETDRFRDVISGINRGLSRRQVKGMLADGRPRDGVFDTDGATSVEILALMQASQRIRELVHELNKDGKDRLRGRQRDIAQQELKVARDDLRQVRAELGQASRDKAAEQQRAVYESLIEAAGKQLDAAKALDDAAQAEVEATKARMAALGEASVSGFDADLFATTPGSSTPWAAGARGPSAADPFAALAAQEAGLLERQSLQQQLAAAGLDGDALEAALSQAKGVEGNQQLAALLASGRVQEFEDTFNRVADLRGSVADDAGGFAYGEQLVAQTAAADQTAAEVRELNATVARMEQHLQLMESGTVVRAQQRERNADKRSENASRNRNKTARRRRRDRK